MLIATEETRDICYRCGVLLCSSHLGGYISINFDLSRIISCGDIACMWALGGTRGRTWGQDGDDTAT